MAVSTSKGSSSKSGNKVINAATLLKEITSKKSPPQSLLVISPDRTRRERITKTLLKKFCKNYDENTHKSEILSVISAEDLNLSNIQNLIDDVNSLSLFSSQKFILINDTELMSAALNKKLLELIQNLTDSVCLIFTASKMAANSQIYNHFSKNNCLLELGELKNIELNRWVQKELKNSGINIADEMLIEALIQSTNSDPDKILELVTRLSLYIDKDKATLEDLSQLSKFIPAASEFALVENLPDKSKYWKSEMLVSQIFNSDKNAFALLGLIARNYTSYMHVNFLRKKGLNLQEIRQKLNISPWIFNKQTASSAKYSQEELYKAFKSILIADAKLKNRNLGDQSVFSELISNL